MCRIAKVFKKYDVRTSCTFGAGHHRFEQLVGIFDEAKDRGHGGGHMLAMLIPRCKCRAWFGATVAGEYEASNVVILEHFFSEGYVFSTPARLARPALDQG